MEQKRVSLIFIAFLAVVGVLAWTLFLSTPLPPNEIQEETILYTDSQNRFEIHYPKSATVLDPEDVYSPFNEPASFAVELDKTPFADTNLVELHLAVALSSKKEIIDSCTKADATSGGVQGEKLLGTETLGGDTFSKFEAHDAAAGNRYDLINYRTVKNNLCYEISTLIHYGAIENYDPGTIKPFNVPQAEKMLADVAKTFLIK